MTTERNGSAAGTGNSSTANGAEPRLPDTPDSLILDGIVGQLGAALGTDEDEEDAEGLDGEPSGEEPDELDDDDAGEDAGEQPEARDPEPSAKQKAPRRSSEEWGRTLATDGLQHISQIPNAALRDPKLLEAYGNERARAAAQQTQTTIAENLRQQEQLRTFVRDVETHFEDDPDGKLAWMESDPQGVVYANAKRYLAQSEAQTPEERVGAAAAAQSLNERAGQQYGRLARFPDLQAELLRRQTEDKAYPATPEGIARLERDVDELMDQGYSRGAGAAGGNGAATGSQPPDRRRPARPLVSSNGANGAAPRRAADISTITDPDELVGVGVTQGLAQLRGRGRPAR